MRIVDSVGWIEHLSGGPLAAAYAPYLSDLADLVTPTIVLYEVYKRTLQHSGLPAARAAASLILKTTVVPLDEDLAAAAAEASAEHGLAMADAIIWATAQDFGATIVTSDAHFQGRPGVEYIPR